MRLYEHYDGPGCRIYEQVESKYNTLQHQLILVLEGLWV